MNVELSLVFKATVLLASVLAAVGLSARMRASRRHLILASSFAALVVLPVAAMLLPAVAVPLLVIGASGHAPEGTGSIARPWQNAETSYKTAVASPRNGTCRTPMSRTMTAAATNAHTNPNARYLPAFIPGAISLGPGWEEGLSYLREGGIPEGFARAGVIVGALADIAIGLAIAFRRTARGGLWAAIAISVFYMIAGTFVLPRLWLDPVGPMLKIWPIVVLNLVALAIVDDR